MAISKQNISGSHALLECIVAEGRDTIFGYPGGAIMPVYDAMYDFQDRLTHILARHEQGAIHAAEAYARIDRKTAVCIATSGPGATNLLTGLYDALLDSTPLVAITGQVIIKLQMQSKLLMSCVKLFISQTQAVQDLCLLI